MKKMNLGSSKIMVPAVAVGCMRMDGLKAEEAASYIEGCMEVGANLFDHADIYGNGECERIFGRACRLLADGSSEFSRDKIFVQSKCGIVPGKMYDLSRDYILKSVDGILERLDMDYLDMLILHRPDALMEPEEVAEAFDRLEQSGKVRYFGVSNQKPMQIELLKRYVGQPLLVNQLQFSLPVSNMVANGLEVNMTTDGSADRDGSVLDYCRLHDITIQAWSPFQMGNWKGLFLGSSEYPELNEVLHELSEKYNATDNMIATAWIMRHPANMQMIAGTMNLRRMEEISTASDLMITREEWYRLYLAAGHILP
ncbi:MAG: aldo/keto reductase family oxidoreductase [Clostridiales bacterium]|nr:aldo/keto reductase family oxidoreductase [Clostridiales bacterium]